MCVYVCVCYFGFYFQRCLQTPLPQSTRHITPTLFTIDECGLDGIAGAAGSRDGRPRTAWPVTSIAMSLWDGKVVDLV